MNEIERFAKDAEDMREAYQSTVEYKGENALCIEKFYLRLWTAAADALREKQARESGCDYCLTTWPNHAGGLSDIWHGNRLSVGYGVYREINYCPMCGKRLEEHYEDD